MSTSTLTASPEVRVPPVSRSRARRLLGSAWSLIVGGLLCQSFLTSVLIVGWCYRLMRRITIREWWKLSDAADKGDSFAEYATLDWHAGTYDRAPQWLVAHPRVREKLRERARDESPLTRLRRIRTMAIGSLITNAKLGGQAILSTWAVTLPGCVLWLFGWYSGWDNSFNKGYEQFWIGVTTGWIGIVLFIGAMLYVPMAQARHAATGDWRSFFQFGVIRTLVRRRWLACLVLAGLYSALAIPVTITRVAPMSFAQSAPETLTMTDAELLEFMRTYAFWTCMLCFAVYVALRTVAARVYARALVYAVRDDLIEPRALRPAERHYLKRLQLVEAEERPERHIVVRIIGWTGSRAARVAGAVATVLLWFTFVAQIFVAEFLNYHPIIGWLNQPLVQLPMFSYIPNHLLP